MPAAGGLRRDRIIESLAEHVEPAGVEADAVLPALPTCPSRSRRSSPPAPLRRPKKPGQRRSRRERTTSISRQHAPRDQQERPVLRRPGRKCGVSGCRFLHRNRPPINNSSSGPVTDLRLIRSLPGSRSNRRDAMRRSCCRIRPWPDPPEAPAPRIWRLPVARRARWRRREVYGGAGWRVSCGSDRRRRRLHAAPQQGQQPEHDQQYRPRLVKPVRREVIQREQHAHGDQGDGSANGGDQGAITASHGAPPPAPRSWAANRPYSRYAPAAISSTGQ